MSSRPTQESPPTWNITASFEDGDAVGDLYTHGRFESHGAELLIRNVKREDVADSNHLASFLNFLGARTLKHGQTAKHMDSLAFTLHVHGKKESRNLVKAHMLLAKKDAKVIELIWDECFVEEADGMTLLSRRLPSGRVLHVDTMDGMMLKGHSGIAHLNFNNADNRAVNLAYVGEMEARKMLLAFVE